MGDHYFTDIQATHELNTKLRESGSKAKWDTITLMSEMSWLFRTKTNVDPVLIPHNMETWGKSYFYDSKNDENTGLREVGVEEVRKNFFVSEVEKITRYAIPFIKTIPYLIGDIKE